MKLNRPARGVVATAACALLLTACGGNAAPAPSGAAPSGGGDTASAPSGGGSCPGKATVTGEGSSAQQNAMAVFIQAYQAKCSDNNVAYNPTGSGAGVKQFSAGLVDFGGSDSALAATEEGPAASRCKGNPAWNIPLVFGPVALAYNVEGVDNLTLNGPTAAKIFSGQIKTWNDPAIAAINAGVNLPATPISVIYRSDDSGTTDNFQNYLQSAGKGAWTKGTGKKFLGGVGEGRERSAGVSQAVSQASGAITYSEVSFAKDNNLKIAKIDSGSGPVELTDETAGKAIDSVKVAGQGNNLKLDLNALYASNIPGVYPLMLATYELVCSKGYDADTSAAVKNFFKIAATDGQAQLGEAGYTKLPDAFKQKVLAAVDAIG